MKIKRVIAIISASVLAVSMISGCGCKKKVEEQANKPTFMYFISNSDENFDETNKVLDELQKEYKNKVDFKIRNIDTDNVQELIAQGQTPTLILIKENEDSQIKYKCNDKEELKNCIENALK